MGTRRGFRDEQPVNDCLYPSVRRSETSVCTEETESMMSDDDSVATDQLLLQPSARHESDSVVSESDESDSVMSESDDSQASSAENLSMHPSARQVNSRFYQDEDMYDDDDDDITNSYYSEDTETSLNSEEYSAGNEDPAGLDSMPIASQGFNRDDSYLDSYSEDDATESYDDEDSVASSEYYDDYEQMQY